jgi:hypothetical protein
MWERDEDRLALLELIELGRLHRRKAQEAAWALLQALPWVRVSSRRDELLLAKERSGPILELLDRVWPVWREEAAALRDAQLAPTPNGWQELQDQRRAAELGELPSRLNRRTATSAVGPDSKSTLTARRRMALGETQITRDSAVRMRPPPGMRIIRGETTFDAGTLVDILGEVTVTERALRDGTCIGGEIKAVLTVENLGPFEDLALPEGWLAIHVPGWNTTTLELVLEHLLGAPLIHFGDLDPAGLRIVRHLRQRWPELAWFVPEFWQEYAEQRGLRMDWPEGLDVSGEPAMVQELRRRGLWLEQELIALDPRVGAELERMRNQISGGPKLTS